MDLPTIFTNVVLPSLLTAILLLLAWRPWNRAAAPTRWQFLLSAAALSLPWIIPAGNRANSEIHLSQWIFNPWTPGDTSRWFLDFALTLTAICLLLALLAPKPTILQPDATTPPRPAPFYFTILNFAIVAALASLIAWVINRGMLARQPLQDDSDAEILTLATKQTSIHITIVAIPLLAATWSLLADRLTARGKSILVPAILSLVALSSSIIILMCGSATLMLLMAALAAMMIATTVLALLSKPALLPAGHTAPFFLILSSILVFTRFNQSQLLPDYFWLLLLTPAGLLVAPAIWSLRPWLRLLTVTAITLIPPLIILWQLYPSWQQKMANAIG